MSTSQRIPVAALFAAASDLFDAECSATPIAPVSETLPGLGIDDAYAIQTHGRGLRLLRGTRVVGHKIGLTSKAMQEMVGVDQPDYGYLLDTMVLDDGAAIDIASLVAARVEAEIAFRLKRTLSGATISVEQVLAATEAVAPALEVIDSRVADWRITITDTIADNASSARAVVGAFRPVEGLDLPGVAMRMDVDGEVVEGRGDAVLGHPALAVAWLAQALHAQGEALEAGEVVLSGALARALPVLRGSRACAELDGLGSVEATF